MARRTNKNNIENNISLTSANNSRSIETLNVIKKEETVISAFPQGQLGELSIIKEEDDENYILTPQITNGSIGYIHDTEKTGAEPMILSKGSGPIDTTGFVKYNERQSLEPEEKKVARENIGASDFNGDYNTLNNKPTIPPEVDESDVLRWVSTAGYTKNTGSYSPPASGGKINIPFKDLDSELQSVVTKAKNLPDNDRLSTLLDNKQDKIDNEHKIKYEYIEGVPSDMEINDGILTIKKNNSPLGTFSANQSADTSINIEVPIYISDLVNDSTFTSNLGTLTGIKMNKSTVRVDGSGIADLGQVITEHQDISTKQDIIDDLQEIREGAARGKLSVQEDDLKAYLTQELFFSLGVSQHFSTDIILKRDGWNSKRQTVTAPYVSPSNTVIVSPSPYDIVNASYYRILCTDQLENELVFECENIPNKDITVYMCVIYAADIS